MKSEDLKNASHITRITLAALDIKHPTPVEKRFLYRLLERVTQELPNLASNFVVRIYETACAVDYPDPKVEAFREALIPVISSILKSATTKAPTPTTPPQS